MDLTAAIALASGLILSGGAAGSAIGDGMMLSKYIEGIARQPEARGELFTNALISVGLIESFPFIALGLMMWFIFAPPFV